MVAACGILRLRYNFTMQNLRSSDSFYPAHVASLNALSTRVVDRIQAQGPDQKVGAMLLFGIVLYAAS